MKIVHQVLSGDVAGGQIVALRLAEAARTRGHEIAFVSPTSGEFLDLARAAGFRASVEPLHGALDVAAVTRLRSLLRNEQADILHTHGHFSTNVAGRIAARLAGTTVIAHMHAVNAFRAQPAARALQVRLDNATARLCARILVVSEATRDSLAAQGYPRNRMEVVYNGIEIGEPAQPQRPVNVPAESPLVLHVGRLGPLKGQRELLEALGRIEGAHALLVGVDSERGGGYLHELEAEAVARGVAERVHFLGYRDDVPRLLAAADLLVLPSHIEGLPLVVLEAMAAGRPAVATRAGGTAELVVDGETGLLVAVGDVAALANAVQTLLRDPERARRLGEAGRRRVEEHFSLERMTDRVLEVYAEIARTMAP